MLQANPTGNFSKQTHINEKSAGKVGVYCLSIKLGGFLYFKTKVLEHKTRKEYNSSCGLAFWLSNPVKHMTGFPERTWHEYHKNQETWVVMVCLIMV